MHGTGNGSGTGGPWEVHGRHVRCMGGASEGHGRCMGDWPTVLGILAWACRLFIRVGAVRSRPQRQRRHRRCPYAMALASARARAEAIGAASDALTPARRLARSRHPHAARRAQLAARSLQLAARSSPPARRSPVLQNSGAFSVSVCCCYDAGVYLRTVISHVCCPSVRPPGHRLSTTNVAASRNTLPSALSRPFRCCDSSVNLPPLRRSRMCSTPFGRRTCPPPWRPCVASTSSPAAERRCWWHPSHRTLEFILSILSYLHAPDHFWRSPPSPLGF